MKEFLQWIVRKFWLQDDICGSFCSFGFFFLNDCSHLWPRNKFFLGQTTGAAERKESFAAGGFDALSRKLLSSSAQAHPSAQEPEDHHPALTDFYLPTDGDSL